MDKRQIKVTASRMYFLLRL